jgi:hypothetical protein
MISFKLFCEADAGEWSADGRDHVFHVGPHHVNVFYHPSAYDGQHPKSYSVHFAVNNYTMADEDEDQPKVSPEHAMGILHGVRKSLHAFSKRLDPKKPVDLTMYANHGSKQHMYYKMADELEHKYPHIKVHTP